jgi:hypothetical protein
MLKRMIASLLVVAMPAAASAGPLKDAAEKAARDLAAAQTEPARSKARFWTGIALISGGGVLSALSGLELGDDEIGPDDGEDIDTSDDGEDSDGWGNKAMLGGGIAAATVGGVLLLTGRRSIAPSVSIGRDGMTIKQTIRF